MPPGRLGALRLTVEPGGPDPPAVERVRVFGGDCGGAGKDLAEQVQQACSFVTFSMSFFPRVFGQQEHEDEGGRQGDEAHP
jgi:hypothetical protein